MAALPETITSPVLTQYKQHLATLLAAASGLTTEQTSLLIEERFDDEYDLSVAMQKTKRFKIDGDLNVIATEWLAKVRHFLDSPILAFLTFPGPSLQLHSPASLSGLNLHDTSPLLP
jgi:hypothetical protein